MSACDFLALSVFELGGSGRSMVYVVDKDGESYVLKCAVNEREKGIDWREEYCYYDGKMRAPQDNIRVPRTFGYYNNVSVHYRGQRAEFPCAVLIEHIKGTPLSGLNGPVIYSPAEALRRLFGLEPTLTHFNEQGYYHMDISVSNIIDAGGEFWLLDYAGAWRPENNEFVYTGELLLNRTPAYHQLRLLRNLFMDITWGGAYCYAVLSAFDSVLARPASYNEPDLSVLVKYLQRSLSATLPADLLN